MVLAGPAVAVVSLVAALLATDAAGLPLRDPDHVAGRRLVLVLCLVAVLVGLDIVVRAARRARSLRPSRAALASVRRERWTVTRGVAVGSALVSFYVTYLAYRNLKSVVPLLRPGDLFDRQLADLDRSLFAGHDPAALMHDLLGTGAIPAHVMSASYMLFFAFIPGTLACALVFSRDLQAGLFYTTAQSINWLLGAASYFVLPSLGPVYAEPGLFSQLPVSGVTQLQELLLDQRLEFLGNPAANTAQSIAAFSSLHVSIFFTGALIAHQLGLWRPVRIGAWLLLVLTIASTIYLGWHYVLDDIGGLLIGAVAVVLARMMTGFDVRASRPPSTRARTPLRTRARAWAASPRWRGVLAGPAVAAVTVLAALVATQAVGLPLRDPDHVAALYLALVGFGVALLVGIDIAIRARRRGGRLLPSRAAMRRVRRERWTLGRAAAVGSALIAFYVTYMAYRNLKSVVPLLRPGELFDRQLAEVDRVLFGGNDPAALLHTLLGVGLPTHFLSSAYVAFIVFLPLTIGLALVFSREVQAGLFYTTAQSINWGLGAASYFLLPALGPIYIEPAAFAALPVSEVTHLQDVLLDQRARFLYDPATGTPQSIAAFASLHISMSFTAALAAHLLGLGSRLRTGLWIWFAVTVAGTVYLGWHYVVDDLAGVVLGAIALVLARALTGMDLRGARQRRQASGVPGRVAWESDDAGGAASP